MRKGRITILAALVALALVAAAPRASAHDEAVQLDALNCDVRESEDLNEEWVRLANLGDHDVSLDGWILESEAQSLDGPQQPFFFPSGITLEPGDTVTVHSGEGDDDTDGSDKHVYWDRAQAVWNDDGDTATLLNEHGDVVDEEDCFEAVDNSPAQETGSGDGPDTTLPGTFCIRPDSAEALQNGNVRLTWEGEGGIETFDFTILRAEGDGDLAAIAVLPDDARSFEDDTTEAGVTYRYSVVVSEDSEGPWTLDCGPLSTVEVTAIPYFPGPLGIALGALGAVGAFLVARRR